jgi:alpha-tubulin suppressor-like RCC1 family protein
MIALLENGDVYAWGKNDMGEVGNGGCSHIYSPYKVAMPIDSGDRVISINAGYEHSTALSASGKLYSWGNQLDGRLGDGVKCGYQRTPKYIRDGVANITDGGSYRYQIIILANGEAWAAGYDYWGKIGNDKDLGSKDGSSNTKGFVIVEFKR